MKPKELTTIALADTTTVQDVVPSTGNRFLDQALDCLAPDAMMAIVALLERHGQDPSVDLARNRLAAQVERLCDPDVIRDMCQRADDGDAEDTLTFWAVFHSTWARL